MKRILFYYYHLGKKERYTYAILQTNMPVEAISFILKFNNSDFKELLKIIDEKDKDATFVEVHRTNLEQGVKTFNPDTLFCLETNKFVTIEESVK